MYQHKSSVTAVEQHRWRFLLQTLSLEFNFDELIQWLSRRDESQREIQFLNGSHHSSTSSKSSWSIYITIKAPGGRNVCFYSATAPPLVQESLVWPSKFCFARNSLSEMKMLNKYKGFLKQSIVFFLGYVIWWLNLDSKIWHLKCYREWKPAFRVTTVCRLLLQTLPPPEVEPKYVIYHQRNTVNHNVNGSCDVHDTNTTTIQLAHKSLTLELFESRDERGK